MDDGCQQRGGIQQGNGGLILERNRQGKRTKAGDFSLFLVFSCVQFVVWCLTAVIFPIPSFSFPLLSAFLSSCLCFLIGTESGKMSLSMDKVRILAPTMLGLLEDALN